MSRRTQRNVGVIGLGIIGRSVADCLRRRGFPTFVWNRTPRPFPNFVGSPAELAELCDFVQIFVSDDEALLQVVQQMKQAFNAHHIVMAHSTVAPATMRATAEIVHRRGAQLLDAPFTGSKLAAEKGELIYYIGGDDAAYRRARPILEASSKEIIEIGEIGQATTIKVATNMITAATVQVAAEALALVHNSGLPLEKFAQAMQGNGSNSGTLTMKLPKMIGGDFDPHFSVKHMLKDVEIAARLARAYGVTLPATEAARDSLLEEMRQGRNDSDYSSVVHSFFPDGPPVKTIDASQAEEQRDLDLTQRQEAEARRHEVESLEEETTSDRAIVAEPAEEQRDVQAENGATESVAAKDNDVAESEGREESRVEPPAEEEPAAPTAPAIAEEIATRQITPSRDDDEEPARRGFFSRLFSKVDD